MPFIPTFGSAELVSGTTGGIIWECGAVASDGSSAYIASRNDGGGNLPGRCFRWRASTETWDEFGPFIGTSKNWKSIALGCGSSVDGEGAATGGRALRIYMLEKNGRAWFTGNGGTSWNEINIAGLSNHIWESISFDYRGQNGLTTINPGRVYRATGPSSWTETRPIDDDDYAWGQVHYGYSSGTVYLGTYFGDGFYRSTDNGVNWSLVTVSSTGGTSGSRLVKASNDGRVILCTGPQGLLSYRLYLSTDSGATFTEQILDDDRLRQWRGLWVSQTGQLLMAHVNPRRIWWSNNYGKSWSVGPTSARWIVGEASYNGSLIMVADARNISSQGRVYMAHTEIGTIIKSYSGDTSTWVPGRLKRFANDLTRPLGAGVQWHPEWLNYYDSGTTSWIGTSGKT